MQTHVVPPRFGDGRDGDGRSTGAVWVAGTGAFLLVAAAAVFVGVRWAVIPDVVKLAVVAALTGACLLAGRSLRAALPATSGVVFHLGAFLIPVDVAAIGVHVQLGWQGMLLAQGAVATVAFTALWRADGSAVLGRAAVAAAVALAAGVAAVTTVPTALLLAAGAVAAERAGLWRASRAWALTAGAAPLTGVLAAGAGHLALPGPGTLESLGLAGDPLQWTAAGSGGLAAWVLARGARRGDDARWAFLALLVGGLGVATTWAAIDAGAPSTALALAAAFLAVEVAALLTDRDPFWRGPLRGLAAAAEAVGVVAVLPATVWVVVATTTELLVQRHPALAGASALVAVAWLAADTRRAPRRGDVTATLLRGSGWPVATVPAALALVAAVAMAAGDRSVTAVAMVAVAAALVAARRPLAHPTAAALAAAALAAASGVETPWLALLVGLAGAGTLAAAALQRVVIWPPRDLGDVAPQALAGLATTLALVAASRLVPELGAAGALLGALAAVWVLAVTLDAGGPALGHVARLGGLAVLPALAGLDAGQALTVAAGFTLLAVVDAMRLDQPLVGVGAAAGVQLVVASASGASGLGAPETGLALCVAAAVWAGLAVVVDDRWRPPFLVAAGLGCVAGLALAAGDARLLADSLVVVGGIGIGGGVLLRRDEVAHVGAGLATLGMAVHLDTAGVVASEAYLAPIAAQLAVAGARARRPHRPGGPVGSWVAYGPAIALLGGAALAERLAGGPAWHALVAGAVGVAAVAAGGWRRLAAPLLLGTALLVAVTCREALAVSAGIPTWAWLAAGGSALLAVGVALDRAGASPADAGRRMVDVVREKYV